MQKKNGKKFIYTNVTTCYVNLNITKALTLNKRIVKKKKKTVTIRIVCRKNCWNKKRNTKIFSRFKYI